VAIGMCKFIDLWLAEYIKDDEDREAFIATFKRPWKARLSKETPLFEKRQALISLYKLEKFDYLYN
jgi:hypothetical protein